ncbi:hypothetical protein HDU98_002358 [Podochytrium sp. JEL0797]|nr:hypothetical protein HDU98_002358 [Podochytrium sp. JEL0797]
MDFSHALLGNYTSYYAKRRSQLPLDARLALVPESLFVDKKVLDIGCNVGLVSLHIARFLQPKSVVGVDVDPRLVQAARRRRLQNAATSRFPSTAPLLFGTLPVVTTEGGLVTREGDLVAREGRLVAREGGLVARDPHKALVFPHNLHFALSNFVTDPVAHTKYDTVLALSITKWVHVKYGDAGIRLFFQKCWSVLNKGGVLVLEPQPWDGYDKAKRMNKDETNDSLQTRKSRLSLRPEDFPALLLKEIGFSKCEKVGTTFNSAKGFQRPIYLVTK